MGWRGARRSKVLLTGITRSYCEDGGGGGFKHSGISKSTWVVGNGSLHPSNNSSSAATVVVCMQLGKHPLRFVCHRSWYTNAIEQNCCEYCSTWWQDRHESINSRYGAEASDNDDVSSHNYLVFMTAAYWQPAKNNGVINICDAET